MKKINEGTLIVCPTCDAAIAELLVELSSGNFIMCANFMAIQDIIPHKQMICDECNSSYFMNGKLHTDTGWQ